MSEYVLSDAQQKVSRIARCSDIQHHDMNAKQLSEKVQMQAYH